MTALKANSRFGAWRIAGTLAVLAGLTSATALLGPADAGSDDPARLAVGQEVYTQACASCHGANLEGQPNWRVRQADGRLPAPPHDDTGHTWHHPDQMLFEITKLGVEALGPEGYESDMPGFADTLSDEQIRAVLAYIKSTWPPEVRAQQERRTERYQVN